MDKNKSCGKNGCQSGLIIIILYILLAIILGSIIFY
jgi:hypothetical protein